MKGLFPIILLCIFIQNILGNPSISFGNYGILGGQDAVAGQFPYQVSIRTCRTWPWEYCEHFCGGSIISPNWILTAGHCYEYGMTIKIYAGVLNISEKEGEFMQIIETNQTIAHSEYKGGAYPNDIRLYELKTPLVYNERVQPINLPAQDSDTTGEGVASGWGYVTQGLFPKLPDTLQFLKSNIPDRETCLELANAKGPNSFNITTNICTEHPDRDHGVCRGDSGGPLAQNNTLVGITSWGFIPCGQKGAPSVFTRVSHYIDWIKSIVPDL